MWTRMSSAGFFVLLIAVTAASPIAWAQPRQVPALEQDNVLTYHGSADRSGKFVVPGLTWQRAKSLHVDEKFHARFAGNVYAQPLYWRAPGSNIGMLLVATEDNTVQALDATTGDQIWTRSLGKPVPRAALRCGNIDPLGITGTPIIDEATGCRGFVGSPSSSFCIVVEGRLGPARLADRCHRRAALDQAVVQFSRPEPARRADHSRRDPLRAVWRSLRRLRRLPWMGGGSFAARPEEGDELVDARTRRRHLGSGWHHCHRPVAVRCHR
jgi:PQQ enzyme repeat